MVDYVATLDILNLTLYQPIKIQNVLFQSHPQMREVLDKIKKDKMPRVTSSAEITFQLPELSQDAAFQVAELRISYYNWLWSFVQDRTVHHWGATLHQIENGERKFLATRWQPVMVNVSYGVPLIRFNQWQLFLETAIPIVSSENFTERTNFILSLHLYLDANPSHRQLTELSILKTWLALEILVNTYCKTNDSEFTLSSRQFNGLRRRLARFITEDSLVENDSKQYLINNLSCVRRFSARKRIHEFLSSYDIKYDEEEIGRAKKVRDSIVHGGRLPNGMDLHTAIMIRRNLRVLLQRAFLAMLGCRFTYSIDNRGFMQPKLLRGNV